MSRILGAVLAGGRSRRFGSDKAMALLGGVPLIEHVLRALAPQVDALIVCGRVHPGQRCINDLPGPGLGPLGGLNAALALAAAEGFTAVLSAGCDLPDLPPDLAAGLAGPGATYIEGCPIVGWWPATLAPRLAAHLAVTPDRSLRAWIRAENANPRSVPLANINRPQDLAAYSIAASSESTGHVENVVSESARA